MGRAADRRSRRGRGGRLMGKILKNVRLFAGGIDLTGESNKVQLDAEVEAKPTTTWGSYDPVTDKVWEEITGGMAKSSISASGLIDTSTGVVDAETWDRFGGHGVWTAGVQVAAVGDPA